ncbi:uncharacterized protein PAC_10389 [Phialocephala subalpina]|uniref:Uncharacterized protein n=1 Tax=Phialocephala subalpina TaxID=576137 RepID=A0A1L7X651_9HELO|nr:uncharacterized protein PAC_10389 [Phialocephala subalpina]
MINFERLPGSIGLQRWTPTRFGFFDLGIRLQSLAADAQRLKLELELELAIQGKISIYSRKRFANIGQLLEASMHLKLHGLDYKNKDRESSLADFRELVKACESASVPARNSRRITVCNISR